MDLVCNEIDFNFQEKEDEERSEQKDTAVNFFFIILFRKMDIKIINLSVND